jgi:hypothetical protein
MFIPLLIPNRIPINKHLGIMIGILKYSLKHIKPIQRHQNGRNNIPKQSITKNRIITNNRSLKHNQTIRLNRIRQTRMDSQGRRQSISDYCKTTKR